ncbi:MAG: hypothetical protein ACOYVK_22260 [Bacillota bacterium]
MVLTKVPIDGNCQKRKKKETGYDMIMYNTSGFIEVEYGDKDS